MDSNLLRRLALIQMEVIPGRPDRNLRTAIRLAEQARAEGYDILAFPEFCLSGYLLGDLWEERSFIADCVAAGQELAASTQGDLLVFGNLALDSTRIGEDGRPRLYNAGFMAQHGSFVCNPILNLDYFPKSLLPNYREFEESRHFYDLRKLAQERKQPFHELVQPVDVLLGKEKLRLGFILCEDGWGEDYGEHLVEHLVMQGAELILNLSASPYTRGKNDKRNRVFAKQAKECKIPIGYVNCIGSQNNGKTFFGFDGCSTLYGSDGAVLAQGDAWSESIVHSGCFSLPVSLEPIQGTSPWVGSSDLLAADAATLCEVVRRYLNSAGITKVVIGVSGGVDSAVSAALFAHLCGPENVLLVSMPSQFNSNTTRNISKQLAQNLNCWFAEIPIEPSVEITRTQIDGLHIQRDGQQATLHLSAFHFENVQARDRSARILSALASAFGGVFPSNANKAEAMVGYCTLFGDHGGFLAPLADLWKAEVYALGRYLNETIWKREVIPETVFTIKPSAELSSAQNPEQGGGDPILYGYHDRLFHSWQQDWNRCSPEEILTWYSQGELESRLRLSRPVADWFPDAASFIADLERWWKLFKGMGVVKRVQAPPVVALSRRAFGFDYRESILEPYFSRSYLALKESLLQASVK